MALYVSPDNTYLALIPNELVDYFSKDEIVGCLSDFRTLTELTKEDLFLLAYEQTNDPGYVDFTTSFQFPSILTSPGNISWMKDVANEFGAYNRLRQDKDKVSQTEVTKYEAKDYRFALVGTGMYSPSGDAAVVTIQRPVIDVTVPDQEDWYQTFRERLAERLDYVLGGLACSKHPVYPYLHAQRVS